MQVVDVAKKETLVAEEFAENEELGNVTPKDIFKIPQIDGTVDSDARYELKIETHDTRTEEDVIEALEAKYYGTLEYNHKDENPFLNYMLIQNLGTESPSKEENAKS